MLAPLFPAEPFVAAGVMESVVAGWGRVPIGVAVSEEVFGSWGAGGADVEGVSTGAGAVGAAASEASRTGDLGGEAAEPVPLAIAGEWVALPFMVAVGVSVAMAASGLMSVVAAGALGSTLARRVRRDQKQTRQRSISSRAVLTYQAQPVARRHPSGREAAEVCPPSSPEEPLEAVSP